MSSGFLSFWFNSRFYYALLYLQYEITNNNDDDNRRPVCGLKTKLIDS